jgi:hypothetical protein
MATESIEVTKSTPEPAAADAPTTSPTRVTLASLQQELASMLSPLDIPGDWSLRQRDDYERQRSELRGRIQTADMSVHTIRKRAPQLQDAAEWLTHLQSWRTLVVDELLAMPNRVYTPQDIGRRESLSLSLTCIDRGVQHIVGTGLSLETLRLGQLMKDSGYTECPPSPDRVWGCLPWNGSMPETEQRVRELMAEVTDAEARLDLALLDDEARAKRAAEERARYQELAGRPTRKTRGDGSQYDKYPDGRIVEVTPATS